MSSPVCILGTGSAVPATLLRSEVFDAKLGMPPGALLNATGVAQRFVCTDETQIDLAIASIHNALQVAEKNPHDVDLIISGCAIPYQTLPPTAPLVMARLGCADGSATAFDVNSTCLSFLTAVETAHHLIASGHHKTAIVFSSEIASRSLPWKDDPETAAIFGDGAGAVVLGAHGGTPARGMVASSLKTYPSAYDACSIGAGGTRFDFHQQPDDFTDNAMFHMDGKVLFRIVSKHLKGFLDDLLDKAGWAIDDIDLVVPHQASPFALKHMIRTTQIDQTKVIDISRDFGNQIAASVPFALDMAQQQGRIHPGSKVLFLGTSAGVSLGGMAWEM